MQEPDLPLSLIEARLLIEPGVARLAAGNAGAEDVENIACHIREMENAVHRRQVEIDSDLAFHQSIVRAAKNAIMMRIVPVILDAIVTTYKDYPRTSADHGHALKEHRAVYEAIKKHAPDEAYQAMQRHLENSYRRTVRRLKT